MKPLISIITVCLNSAALLEKTIKSVSAQKIEGLEYIIIDGGSEDDTCSIIEHHKENIDRVLSEPDDGIYDAMNKGIRLSKGKYLIFMNAGDILIKDSIVDLAPTLDGDTDIYYYAYYNYAVVGNKKLLFKGSRCHDLSIEIPTCHNAMIFSREAFDKYGLYDTKYKLSADYEWLCRNRNSLKTEMRDTKIALVLLGGLSEIRNLAVLKEKAIIARKYFGDTAYKRQVLRIIKIFPLSVLKWIFINVGIFYYYLYLKHLLTGVKNIAK